MPLFTLVVPYYRQPTMLMHQLSMWEVWPREIPIILIDDGSLEPARDAVMRQASKQLRERLTLYRVDVDIPWNRGGARNLGTQEAKTEWIVHIDIDHVMNRASALALGNFIPDRSNWYKFQRFRVGRADETRKKDGIYIPDDCVFGQIKPHIDSYMTTKAHYWAAGGYDEDYSGCLGGGTPMTKALAKLKPASEAPDPICLHVYTRDKINDSSELHLSRDTAEFSRRRQLKEANGKTKPEKPIRFPWHREDLV